MVGLTRGALRPIEKNERPLALTPRNESQHRLNVFFYCQPALLILNGREFLCKEQVELDVVTIVADRFDKVDGGEVTLCLDVFDDLQVALLALLRLHGKLLVFCNVLMAFTQAFTLLMLAIILCLLALSLILFIVLSSRRFFAPPLGML